MALTAKQEAMKFLAEVPAGNVFWSHDGRTFSNLRELSKALSTMSDEDYAYHANTAKNDFSNWVKDVVGDEKLADNLRRVADRAQAATQVSSRVAVLTKRLG